MVEGAICKPFDQTSWIHSYAPVVTKLLRVTDPRSVKAASHQNQARNLKQPTTQSSEIVHFKLQMV